MPTEKQQRAEQASQVLSNPVFQEAFDRIYNAIVEAIADAPIEDSNLRNQLGLQLGAAKALKTELFDVINDARLEKIPVEKDDEV